MGTADVTGPSGPLSGPRGSMVQRDASRAEAFEWGSIQWLVNAALVPGAGATFGYVEILPGRNNPLHYHPNADEVLHLIEGELDHRVGDDHFRLVPGSTLHVPRGVPHNATNTGAVIARMLVTYPTGERQMVLVEAATAANP